MLSLCCTKIIRNRLGLPAQLPAPVQPSTRLGNWYVHLARFGHQQIVLATSERSLLTVLLAARQLRKSIEINFQAAVAELLAALQLPAQIVSRELSAIELCPSRAVRRRPWANSRCKEFRSTTRRISTPHLPATPHVRIHPACRAASHPQSHSSS